MSTPRSAAAGRRQLGPPAPVNGGQRLFRNTPRVLVGVVILALLSAALVYNFLPEGVQLDVGSVSPQDFVAPRSAVDRYRTAEERERAAGAIPDYFRFAANLATAASAELNELTNAVRTILEDETLDREAREAAVLAKLPGEADLLVARQVIALGDEGWATVLARLRANVVQVMSTELNGEQTEAARDSVGADLRGMRLETALTNWLVSLADAVIQPTMVLDVEETNRRRSEAMSAVPQVIILKDQIIARRGDVISAHQLTLLQDFGMLRSHFDPLVIAGGILLAVALLSVTSMYIRLYERQIYDNTAQLLLLGLLATLVLLITQFTQGISGYLAPVAAGTMLAAILLSPRLALFFGLVIASVVGLITGADIHYAIVAAVGGAVGVFSLSWVGQRSDLSRAGVLVGVTSALTALALSVMGGQTLNDLAMWRQLGFAFLNGIVSAVLTIGTLPFFESTFGVLTAVRLLEYANPNQPLLRRLLVEAPGTYHHSVVVGNLAEAAADVVGANPLLARVGAYYHDIGKVARPYFFIENQIGQDNPHDKISPGLSTLIITSHVKDGVALAEEAKLPTRITDFIRSHHGRTLVSYFYSRASGDAAGQALAEEDFRYPGPLPQTREEAIVMLADSVEAAVRSMANPSANRIEALIKRLIRERLVDGQLEKCDLTLKDLDRIGETFLRVLGGIFHARIEYPEDNEDLIKQMQASGMSADEIEAAREAAAEPDDNAREDGERL